MIPNLNPPENKVPSRQFTVFGNICCNGKVTRIVLYQDNIRIDDDIDMTPRVLSLILEHWEKHFGSKCPYVVMQKGDA